MARIAVLGSGYIGAEVGRQALARGDEVVLADNWDTTPRAAVERLGAEVVDCDVRSPEDVGALLARGCDRLVLLAAQASRPRSIREPGYTETTNLVGPRVVAEAVAQAPVPVVYGSSLHVYGPASGEVGPDHPYGPQGDLAHLSKVYAELCLRMYADRHGLDVGLARLAIAFGPSPVQHDGPENVTVVDKFRRLAAAGEPLPLDDGGRATIGVVHVADCARVLLDWSFSGVEAVNVCAEAVTVADIAALAEGRERTTPGARTYPSPFAFEHDLAGYLAP